MKESDKLVETETSKNGLSDDAAMTYDIAVVNSRAGRNGSEAGETAAA